MVKLNSTGDRVLPCLTALPTWNWADRPHKNLPYQMMSTIMDIGMRWLS